MEIKRNGSQPSGKGSPDWFTGTVRVDPLFTAPDPARVRGASVTFEPSARTAWHTHPLGQTLIGTAGWGRAQRWGGPIEEIRSGDVVWFEHGWDYNTPIEETMTALHDGVRAGQARYIGASAMYAWPMPWLWPVQGKDDKMNDIAPIRLCYRQRVRPRW